MNKIFTANRSGANWLIILRVGTASALIAKIISEFRSIDLLYGSKGLVPVEISYFSQNPYIPSLNGIFHQLGSGCTESHFLTAFFLCQLAFAIFLLLRFATRLSALMCWLMQIVVFNSTHLTSYGFDAVLLSMLFYSLIFPVGQRSSDRAIVPFYQKIIQVHVCIIYFANGISKSGPSWHDGSGIWDAINQPQFHSCLTPLLQKFLMINHMPELVSWSIIIVEIAYPFLIWVHRANCVILILILSLHLFIALVFGLWLFAFLMIVINLAAFGDVLWRNKMVK